MTFGARVAAAVAGIRFRGVVPIVLMAGLILAVGAYTAPQQDAFLTSLNLHNLLLEAMPLVRISQTDVLRLTLPVPESVVARIRNGSPVEVRVDSLQRVFQGKIARFAGQLNSATRTMETEVDLPNPSGVILPVPAKWRPASSGPSVILS